MIRYDMMRYDSMLETWGRLVTWSANNYYRRVGVPLFGKLLLRGHSPSWGYNL